MVAPSFQDYEKVSEVYEENKKKYIDVKNPNTGKVRKVRFYTEEEYAKVFPKTMPKKKAQESEIMKNLRQVRGFSLGPIQVVYGNIEENELFLRDSNARWACGIGWYFVSEENIPMLPNGLKYIPLYWEEAKDIIFKPEQLEKIIKEKIKNESN